MCTHSRTDLDSRNQHVSRLVAAENVNAGCAYAASKKQSAHEVNEVL